MTTQENILARHKILHELGRGATGAVYAARERTTGALVALKRLDPPLHARGARRLDHPNIVRVLDAGEAAGTAYVTMELVEGESLKKLLEAGPIPVARALRILGDVARGLAHAHLEGVVHGAIRPSNVLVLRSGVAKLADFGLGPASGPYRAPEEANGGAADHRSDLYSLGVLFYEMLAGRPGAPGAPAPSELNPNVPRAVDALVARMLAAQPAVRMPGVPVLLEELKRIEEALGLSSQPASTPEPRPKPVQEPPRAPAREPQPEPRIHASPPRFEEPARARDPFRHLSERELLAYQLAMMERERRQPPPASSSRPGPVLFAALAVVLTVAGFGIAGFLQQVDRTEFAGLMNDWSQRIGIAETRTKVPPAPAVPPTSAQAKTPEASPLADPPASVATAPKEVVTPAPTAAPLPPQPLATAPDPLPPDEPPALARKPEPPALARAPEPPPPPVERAPAKQLPQLPPPPVAKAPAAPKKVASQQKTARLILDVSPSGELYINGEHQGSTPPITTFHLEPGMHRVEVRNGSRKPYLTYMTVEAGDVRRIRHDFNAKPIRPPG